MPPQKTNEEKYNDAKSALSSGDYGKAYNLFRETKSYADSSDFLEDFEVICEKKITTLDNFKTTETFNKDGKPLEVITEKDKEITKKVYTYDENSNPLSYTVTKDGIELAGFECSYDKESDGSVSDEADISTDTYTYDSYGNLLSETSEYSDKKTTARYEYTGITVVYNPKK